MTIFKKWWEREPLRFECQPDCFKCCSKPGIVYFDQAAIKSASKIIKVSTESFKKKFLRLDNGNWIHKVETGKPCSFLTTEGCAIHSGKPLQCRSYPFWHENMTSRSMWKLVGAFCPGIDVGPNIALASVQKFLDQFKL